MSLIAVVVGTVVTLGLIVLWRALTAEPPPSEEAALEAAEAEAFREVGGVRELAAAAAPLFWDRETFVRRRVEQLELLDFNIARRRISVDFEVPDFGAEDGEELSYLPLSVLRNWPPVLAFDLRDEWGAVVPLLSKGTTNLLDERVLTGVAEYALGAEVHEHVAELLHSIVHGEGDTSRHALRVLSLALQEYLAAREEPIDPEPFRRLIDLATIFVDSTLLWIDVRGQSGTRRVVKVAYDVPVKARLAPLRSLLTTLGLRSVLVGIDVPHVSDAGSYHLEMNAPPGLEVVAGALVLDSDPAPPGLPSRVRQRAARILSILEDRLAITLGRRDPRPVLHLQRRDVQLLTGRVHYYISGPRRRSTGVATVLLLPERRRLLAGALVTGLVACILTAYRDLAPSIVASDAGGVLDGAVAFLLLTPAFLAYTLAREPENAFLQRVLSGTRALSIFAIMLPVVAAGVLLHEAANATSDAFALIDWLFYGAWIAAVTSALPLVVPRRSWNRSD
ncbi:hypothetical protein [Solirubrobacter pauli]|uniref:hypothetical protein n=1 Tax=Solirubrobacter pauli TaxID=166793 RepID=UPI0011C42B2C|nr:hypothetical protein [Solirubrobacter pauli]